MGLDWSGIRQRYEQRLDEEEACGLKPVERDALRRAEARAAEAKEAKRLARKRDRTIANPQRATKYDRQQIASLYGSGLSMKAVAREMGCDQWTVSKALRAVGATIRPQTHPGRPRKVA